MHAIDHSELEAWASQLGATAVLGFVASILIIGKVLHHFFVKNGLLFGVLVVPPAFTSGLVGLAILAWAGTIDAVLADDLSKGLESLKVNLMNFVFSALILGLHTSSGSSQVNLTFRGIIMYLLHEGLLMVVYSQILIWGYSVLSMLLIWVCNSFFGASIPPNFAVMVPAGMESGADVLIGKESTSPGSPGSGSNSNAWNAGNMHYYWNDDVVSESESLGLVAVSVVAIIVLSCRGPLQARGILNGSSVTGSGSGGSVEVDAVSKGKGRSTEHLNAQVTGEGEVFGRSPAQAQARTGASSAFGLSKRGGAPRSGSSGGLEMNTMNNNTMVDVPLTSGSSSSPPPHAHADPRSDSVDSEDLQPLLSNNNSTNNLNSNNNNSNSNTTVAGLGSHLSLIAFTSFASFGLTMLAHILEIQFSGHFGTLLTGVRMFKLSMFGALLAMVILTRTTNVRFNREWFMLLCGLFLDLVVVAALSKSNPKPHNLDDTTHYGIVSTFVLVALLWNFVCYGLLARKHFPNFQFERALVIGCSTMGNSFCGLLFARVVDPQLLSPVPAAFAAKLMLFFIPSSAAKNKIVFKFIHSYGLFLALVTCTLVLITWWVIFTRSFASPVGSADTGPSSKELEKAEELDEGGLSGRSGSPVQLSRRKSKSNGGQSGSGLVGVGGVGAGGLNEDLNGDLSGGADGAEELELSSFERDRTGFESALSPPIVQAHEIRCSEQSAIVSHQQMALIASWLSATKAHRTWDLNYSLVRDGASMGTLISQCRPKRSRGGGSALPSASVLLVEDSHSWVFGAYIAHNFEKNGQYYGNGESFVFSLTPEPKVYRWTKANNLFVISDNYSFAIGGGGDGFAIQLDEDLDTGVSNRSGTYENEQLSSGEFFKCLNVEVWNLGDPETI